MEALAFFICLWKRQNEFWFDEEILKLSKKREMWFSKVNIIKMKSFLGEQNPGTIGTHNFSCKC
jgi:hypothetical protein